MSKLIAIGALLCGVGVIIGLIGYTYYLELQDDEKDLSEECGIEDPASLDPEDDGLGGSCGELADKYDGDRTSVMFLCPGGLIMLVLGVALALITELGLRI